MIRRIVLSGRPVDYELTRKRVKNLNLRVRSDGSVHVSAPHLVPQAAIDRFLTAQGGRILAAIDRVAARSAARPEPRQYADGESVYVWGEPIPLRIKQSGRASVSFDGRALTLTVRDTEDAEEKRRALDCWYRREAEEKLTALCRRFYPAFEARGVAWPELRFRKMRSRWGSCQPKKGVICLNTRLAALPEPCAEYVVVHEFCHFFQPNHSSAFYAEVSRLLPDWAERRALTRRWEAVLDD